MKNITIGLVAAPELPAKIVYKLQEGLENDLQERFSIKGAHWKVEVEIDRITGAADTISEIINETKRLKEAQNWDYAISVTDLPVFHKKNVVLADVNEKNKVGQISLPALGMTPTVKRVKYILFLLINELYYRNIHEKYEIQFNQKGIGVTDKPKKKHFFGRFINLFYFSSVRRVEYPESEKEVSVRFLIIPKWGGLPTILSGMTIANQPWTIMASFKKVVGLAFATGSYMLVFTTLWSLSYLYDLSRFILLMFFAIGGMTTWIIFAHNLWENKKTKSSNALRHIYNASTLFTLLSSIIIFYISLFMLFLIAVAIFVPPDMFEEVIGGEVGPKNYLSLVWLVTSAATVAGAIGAGLEKEESVRSSTYGYRQYVRSKEVEEQEEEQEAKTNKSLK